MAATSVLEPIVLLYRFTGDPRYLDFARYIVEIWDEPDGPRIADHAAAGKGVNKTANGKAYEMLSNLVGLCELARATGDRQPARAGDQRLERHRRATGSTSPAAPAQASTSRTTTSCRTRRAPTSARPA